MLLLYFVIFSLNFLRFIHVNDCTLLIFMSEFVVKIHVGYTLIHTSYFYLIFALTTHKPSLDFILFTITNSVLGRMAKLISLPAKTMIFLAACILCSYSSKALVMNAKVLDTTNIKRNVVGTTKAGPLQISSIGCGTWSW